MAETLSSLVDKLSIVNIKIFHLQDRLYEATRQGVGLDADTTSKLANTNLERAKLSRELDELFARAVKSGYAEVVSNTKVTGG